MPHRIQAMPAPGALTAQSRRKPSSIVVIGPCAVASSKFPSTGVNRPGSSYRTTCRRHRLTSISRPPSDSLSLPTKKVRWQSAPSLGVLPFWVKDLKGGISTINARIETVATKPAFRSAFKSPRRCLVPMSGYYEWKQFPDLKQPFFIHRTDHLPLFAARLWEPRHRLQDERDLGSCTVITQDAVDVGGEVHDRMPVFLHPLLIDVWASATVDDAMAMLLAAQLPALSAHPVTRALNNARNRGGPEFLEPVDLPTALS